VIGTVALIAVTLIGVGMLVWWASGSWVPALTAVMAFVVYLALAVVTARLLAGLHQQGSDD
jgi:hypothetical protein